MSIFVSYRRDDAAGHAGRLCDDLADRVGAAEVFHDIDSIAPGEDFVSSIQRAIASADVVLAVIGPDWATVSDSQGRQRLSDPGDVVRMEIATALHTGKPVIPVLVGGASMPDGGVLPSDLAPLARRNAIEVRAESWDDDTAKLVRSLGRPGLDAPRTAAWRRRPRWVVGAVIAAAAVVVAFLLADRNQSEVSTSTATSAASVDGDIVAPDVPSSGPASPLTLPAVARTILHPLGSEGMVFTVDAASLAPGTDGAGAQLTMTFENRAPYDDYVDRSEVQLVADGAAVNPAEGVGVLVPARAAETATLDYALPAEARELVVRVHDGDQVGEIPLTGPRAVPPVAPAVVTTLAPAELGTTSFTFGAPQLEAYSDRHLVGIPVHAVNNDRYDAPFSDREFRMLIDGDPRAPVGFLGEAIPAMASADATLWWEVPLGSGPLVLRIEHQGAQAEVPVTN